MSVRIFTLIMNNLFILGPRIIRKVDMSLIGFDIHRVLIIACFISWEKWASKEK
jgi:hypothetical protein